MTIAHLPAGSRAPRPVHQAAPQASLRVSHPQLAREAAEKIYDFAKTLLPEGRVMADRDLEDVLTAARELVEVERSRRASTEMTARLVAQQQAEQLRRDKLTERDPEVIEARDTLKRLNSAGLQLLLQAEGLTPAQKVAATALLRERANDALLKATTTEATPGTPA